MSERACGPSLRALRVSVSLPFEVKRAILQALQQLGPHEAYAVRSSATAEDLPTASFAGQHDSFLHISGVPALLQHIRLCWASLFCDRAIAELGGKSAADILTPSAPHNVTQSWVWRSWMWPLSAAGPSGWS